MGIKINKYLREMLLLSTELSQLIKPENIQAMVLSPTSFPFISYCRTNLETRYNKGYQLIGNVSDEVEIQMAVVSTNYDETINIASAVRKALEFHQFRDESDNIFIDEITMLGASEDFNEDVYIQYLTFNFSIQRLN
jgi:hypothetical protein